MGTVVNGNVWSGACVNGKVVSGLVKNGAVFYKKQLIDLYKRRVMVGDNLRNKVVYGDFKMGYYVTLMNADEEDSITCNNNHLDTVYEYITSDYCSVDNNMRDSSSNLSLYEYDATNGTEILNNNSLIKNDKDYIVSEIIDNATYRHLFIKDPNIRPIQVGDVITRNTRFYFTIPDDIFSKTNIGTNPIRLDNGSTLSVLEYSSPKRIRFYVNDAISSTNDVVVYENDKITTNKSSMIVSPVSGNYFEGTVSRVESNSLVYNMTFVDVRTLG